MWKKILISIILSICLVGKIHGLNVVSTISFYTVSEEDDDKFHKPIIHYGISSEHNYIFKV